MIEVICSSGDRAEAPTPEGALQAARTMRDDHFDSMPVQGRGRDLTFVFLNDGEHVRTVNAGALA